MRDRPTPCPAVRYSAPKRGGAAWSQQARSNWGAGRSVTRRSPRGSRLPEGMTLHECAGVAVDAEDLVYLLTRNVDNPVIVLEPDGGVLRSFGAGVFTDRTHAISVGPDGFLYCADDGSHTITKWTREGELVLTIGEPGVSSERHSGEPFNRPTDAAVSSNDGSIFISDGYGNARIHRYSAGGELELSWGEAGHRRRAVHGAAQPRDRRRRPDLRRGPREPSRADLRPRRRAARDVEQHPPPLRHDDGRGRPALRRRAERGRAHGGRPRRRTPRQHLQPRGRTARAARRSRGGRGGRDASSRRTGWRWTRAATSMSPRSPTRSAAATSTRLGSCAASRSCGGWGSDSCPAPLRRRPPHLTLSVRKRNPYARQP